MQKYLSTIRLKKKIERNKKGAEQKKQLRTCETKKEKVKNIKIPYGWPAPIDDAIKKKCLINFVDKMSKKEILQKTCCICNRIGFNKNFKEVKFSDLKNRELLEPTKDLVGIVPGVGNKIIKTEKEIFEIKVNTDTESPSEVIVCEDGENVDSSIADIKNKGQNCTNILKCANTDKTKNVEEENDQINNSNAKKNNESYFCYENTILYKTGIHLENGLMTDNTVCNICSKCSSSLNRKKPVTPDFSPANDCFIGDVPEELQNLTIPEEHLISLYRHNKCIIKIQARTYNASTRQSKISGNVIVFQQNIGSIAKTLPFAQDSLCDSIKEVFVGANPPSKIETSKLLRVRRQKIKDALEWLIQNNPLYKDITFSEKNINDLPDDAIPNSLWITMDLTTNVDASNACRSGYTNENSDNIDSENNTEKEVINESDKTCEADETIATLSASALIDVDGVDISTDDIQNHILNNTFVEKQDMKTSDNTYFMIPHSEKPVNQYANPLLLLALFPTLFPYGLGNPDDPNRKIKTCYKTHLQYLLSYQDKRFEKHHSFLSVVFNMLQRRNACYSAKLMMNQPYSQSYAQQISNVKSVDVEQALKIISEKNKNTTFHINPDVNRLVKQVKAVGGNVQARSKLRVNLHSLIYNRGLPHIFLTINPADTCNPVALYICGVDIDFENVFNKFPSGYVRSQITASHPVSTSTFFKYLIENIINALIMGGVLGPMDSYFGPVESQGRGSLHVHMLLWLSHKLKPKDMMEKISDPEFRVNLIKYLEDIVKETISEYV